MGLPLHLWVLRGQPGGAVGFCCCCQLTPVAIREGDLASSTSSELLCLHPGASGLGKMSRWLTLAAPAKEGEIEPAEGAPGASPVSPAPGTVLGPLAERGPDGISAHAEPDCGASVPALSFISCDWRPVI